MYTCVCIFKETRGEKSEKLYMHYIYQSWRYLTDTLYLDLSVCRAWLEILTHLPASKLSRSQSGS